MSIAMIVLLMAVTTALPRMLSVLIFEHLALPPWANRWLQSVPYAVLGALIFPGILGVNQASPAVGFLGGLAAFLLAYKGMPIVYVIVGAIGTVLFLNVWL